MESVVWFVGALLGNGIGCLLAVFCLVRTTDQRRTARNRFVLVFIGSWALVETARDDTLLVAAASIHADDYQVRFFLAPSMVLTAVAVAFTTIVLWLVAARPRPAGRIAGGVAIGLLLAAISLQAALSGRTGSTTSIDVVTVAAAAAGLGVATGITVWLATGAAGRPATATAVALPAICLTVAEYLITGALTADSSATADSNLGLNPIHLVVFTAVAFGVRAIVLTVMSMVDDEPAEPPVEQARTTRQDAGGSRHRRL